MASGGRRLRGLRAERVIRAFEKAGYAISRVSGSHYVLKYSERPTVIIPRHNPVKTGLLIDQVKASGLTIDEFEELL
ncbi:MAG TPA: type II toxin-antitoxin system HicA family toxin [Dehalococcoidia bacterium]|nr:type II toxin-antitoxin system HicA family toxin [Dehalococcoidia bacterium]